MSNNDPKDEKKKKKHKRSGLHLLNRVSELDVAFAIRHISIMIKSGLALEATLRVLAEQTDNPKLRAAFEQILLDVQSGTSVAESMKKFPKIFSTIVVAIVNTGEQGGSLEKNLLFLTDYLKKNHELHKKISGALLYPMIVLSLTVAEMLGVVYFILPKLQSLFSSFGNVPAFTQLVLNLADFIRANGVGIVIVLAILFFLLTRFLKTSNGQKFKDKFILRFPVLSSLYKNEALTTFARTLSILLQNGIPLAQALNISQDTVGNSEYSKILAKVQEEVRGGQRLGTSLEEYDRFFPGTFIKMIDVGEQTGTLEENLNYLYEFYQGEVEEIANNLTALLEPILLVFIGVMIGGLAVMIIGPIYQLTGTING